MASGRRLVIDDLTVRDSQGKPVSNITAPFATQSLLGRIILLGGLLSNTQYSYTLITTSRGDIAPVSGSFQTSQGTDTTSPQISSLQINPKDPHDILFGITPTEKLIMGSNLFLTSCLSVSERIMDLSQTCSQEEI